MKSFEGLEYRNAFPIEPHTIFYTILSKTIIVPKGGNSSSPVLRSKKLIGKPGWSLE